ncbi:MAG: hypothetical protein SV186_05955 [Candidatus Nanohaloarchaea archaeon]|nr:hypothetical protein [Candidatus Nanohaloarchaea archaeon]
MKALPRTRDRDEGRSGQAIGIDFVIGLSIFVVTVTIGLFYSNTLAVTSSPFSQSVQAATAEASQTFREETEWNVYSLPVELNTSYVESRYPVEIRYVYPADVDPNSTVVMHEGGHIPSQIDYQLNATVFYANLSGTGKEYRPTYTRNTDLTKLNYTKHVFKSGSEIWNEDVNVTVATAGIADLTFQGQTLLTGATFNTGTPTINYTKGSLRVHVLYNGSDRNELRLFGQDNRVRLAQEDHSGDATYTFDLIDSFDEVYVANYSGDSQTNSTGQSGTIYSGEADIADFHLGSGGTADSLALMNEDMQLTVANNSGDLTADVTLDEPDERLLLLPHTGEEGDITTQTDLFFDPPTVTVYPVERQTGLSLQQIRGFSQLGQEVLRTTLGLSGLGFNLSVGTYVSLGEEFPGSQQVAVQQQPTTLLGRYANTTQTELRLAVWL